MLQLASEQGSTLNMSYVYLKQRFCLQKSVFTTYSHLYDDGMEIDANVVAVPEAVEEEEEELERVEDEDGEGVVDADTDEDV